MTAAPRPNVIRHIIKNADRDRFESWASRLVVDGGQDASNAYDAVPVPERLTALVLTDEAGGSEVHCLASFSESVRVDDVVPALTRLWTSSGAGPQGAEHQENAGTLVDVAVNVRDGAAAHPYPKMVWRVSPVWPVRRDSPFWGLLPFPWVGPAIFPCRWVGPRVRAGRSLTCRFACQRARRGSRVKGRTQSGRAAMRSTLDAGEVRP